MSLREARLLLEYQTQAASQRPIRFRRGDGDTTDGRGAVGCRHERLCFLLRRPRADPSNETVGQAHQASPPSSHVSISLTGLCAPHPLSFATSLSEYLPRCFLPTDSTRTPHSSFPSESPFAARLADRHPHVRLRLVPIIT
jgi:hypothetical protein